MFLEMMFVALTGGCPRPTKHILDGSDWVHNDRVAMKTAERRCVFHYPDQPCLIRFFKKGYNDYYAECGRKR